MVQVSHDRGATWDDLVGEASDTYTPVTNDHGALLRVTANYADAEGPAKSATTMWSYTVGDPTVTDTSLGSMSVDGVDLAFRGRTTQFGVSTRVKSVPESTPENPGYRRNTEGENFPHDGSTHHE